MWFYTASFTHNNLLTTAVYDGVTAMGDLMPVIQSIVLYVSHYPAKGYTQDVSHCPSECHYDMASFLQARIANVTQNYLYSKLHCAKQCLFDRRTHVVIIVTNMACIWPECFCNPFLYGNVSFSKCYNIHECRMKFTKDNYIYTYIIINIFLTCPYITSTRTLQSKHPDRKND